MPSVTANQREFTPKQLALLKKDQRAALLRGERLDVILAMIKMAEAPENDIAEYTLQGALQITSSRTGFLDFLNDDGHILTRVDWPGRTAQSCDMDDAACLSRIDDGDLWGEAIRRKAPIIFNGPVTDVHSASASPASSYSTRRHMCVPVFCNGRPVAVACVEDKITEYTPSDAKILSLLLECMWNIFLAHRHTEEITHSQEMFKAIFDSINDGVFLHDVGTGKIQRANRKALRMYGYDEESITGLSFAELSSGEYPYTREQAESYLLKTVEDGPMLFEWQTRNSHGDYFWAEVSMKAFEFNGNGMVVVVVRDISKHKQLEESLNELTFKDKLTGVANKSLLFERLGQAIKRKSRDITHNYCIFFIDMERFKTINDRFGYTIGDEVLHQIAERLTSCIRSIDTVSRYGSDDFVILLDGFDANKTAIAILKRIREVINTEMLIGDTRITIKATIGIAFGAGQEKDADELIRKASVALQRAQQKGSHRFRAYSAGMKERFDRKISLEIDLEQALKNNEFYMVYQPIVYLKTGKWNGLEALLRWEHKDHGLVSPSEFIPIIENTRKMPLLEAWIIQRVVSDIRKFVTADQRFNELEVAINISAKHFMKFEFITKIKSMLTEFETNSFKLCFEMTETSMMTGGGGLACSRFDALRARGFKIAIDDFGTGYSSLSYLSQLPVDKVKIDRKFIHNLEHNLSDRKITKAIIGLAKDLGFQVVAEGVETPEQRDLLISYGCELAQGFLFAKPLSHEDALSGFMAL